MVVTTHFYYRRRAKVNATHHTHFHHLCHRKIIVSKQVLGRGIRGKAMKINFQSQGHAWLILFVLPRTRHSQLSEKLQFCPLFVTVGTDTYPLSSCSLCLLFLPSVPFVSRVSLMDLQSLEAQMAVELVFPTLVHSFMESMLFALFCFEPHLDDTLTSVPVD